MNKDKIRVNPNFKKILEDVSPERIINKVDRKMHSFPEITEMMINTPSFPNVLRELKTIPRKEDIRCGK